MADRIRRAKQAEPKWDPRGEYAAKCAELARAVGKDPSEVYEEFCERSGARHICGGLPIDDAERLAWTDVLERFEVVL